MPIFTRRDKKRKCFTIFYHIFDLKVCKGQAKAFSEPLVMTFMNSWNMREVSVALGQVSTRLPSLNQGKCFSREHIVNLRTVKGIIPSMVQEELTKNQSVRTSRIVTRFLEMWIWQNHTVTSFLLVQNVADLAEIQLCGKVPHTPVSRTREVL